MLAELAMSGILHATLVEMLKKDEGLCVETCIMLNRWAEAVSAK